LRTIDRHLKKTFKVKKDLSILEVSRKWNAFGHYVKASGIMAAFPGLVPMTVVLSSEYNDYRSSEIPSGRSGGGRRGILN